MYETENSAFVGGSLVPFNGNVDPMYAVLDPRFDQCQSVDGTMSSDPSVFPSALLGKLTKSDIDPIDSATSEETLEATYLPIDCENIELPPNQGTVWGQGITKFDDNITDNPDQWSHFNNFDSSLSAWILSTGNISQVAQTPNAEADGILGKPGDELLTLLSGQETFDAVRYTINLKPTGNYLHIKYALASEEYPEWVGQFNDVMAILVGGVNCALIPETETAVSINTINAGSFPWLYIDNQSENPDRLNVFDGMTVPLTCNAAVTPNQNVTVEIIIADAGDEHLDSAVALFDNGIWSDNFPTVD
jgi:hypothetical protein